MMRSSIPRASLLLACATLTGCTFGGGAKPTTAPSVVDEAANRARLVTMAQQVPPKLDTYDADAAHLPGSTFSSDRTNLEAVLDDLSAALPALAGDNSDSIVNAQLGIIQKSRQQLAAIGPTDPADQWTSAALQAAYQALDDISTNEFPSQTNLQVPIAALRSQLDDSDSLQGDASRAAVADAAHRIGAIMRLMDKDIEATLETSTTQPSMPPPPMPSGEPSTGPGATR